ncbi:DUF6230 family protein [Streptomyces sp. ASQP_92]|uniref:DUF6230 family protein n=1 Tax=Streptomyces sp. ASQP_92 TaxID=2979116 RepID=UPI0021C072D9|nr:DUF6230 family protein [Streptomyces sp. ASQP_92]MCT9091446.1 DUF6230 family protein [Streptomyces sp. ASQP_92]
MESQVRGGTRWKRFALVMVPSVAATAAIGVGLAQGALAASFSVSGVDFKVTAQELVGNNLLQYGSVATGKTLEGKDAEPHPVVVSGFSDAKITNMCQSVVQPLPFGLGNVTMTLRAGQKEQIEASNLYLDVSQLDTDATFTNIDIGVAAGEGKRDASGKVVTKIQPGADGKTPGGNPYGFAQRADVAKLQNVSQRAWATTAGTFKLPGLSLRLSKGGPECELPKAAQ